MHITEGILSGPVLAGGGALAAVGVWIGLRSLRDEDIPKTAMCTAAFFVAGLVHLPIGPVAVHLSLIGLLGLMLGWRAFPAVVVALLLQAVLFRFGGLSTLGVNTVIMAAPAVVVGIALRPFLLRARVRSRVMIIGALAGGLGIALGAACAALTLLLPDESYRAFAFLFAASYAPLMVIEATITAGLVLFLWRVKPDILGVREVATT